MNRYRVTTVINKLTSSLLSHLSSTFLILTFFLLIKTSFTQFVTLDLTRFKFLEKKAIIGKLQRLM